MDPNKKSPPRARAGKKAVEGGAGATGNPGRMGNAQFARKAPEPAPRSADQAPDLGPRCEVDGQRVSEFRALIDGQAGVIITDKGTWTFSRVYFCPSPIDEKPGFDLGDGHGRAVAGQRVLSAKFDTGQGLWVHFSDYTAFVPAQAIKASWKTPA